MSAESGPDTVQICPFTHGAHLSVSGVTLTGNILGQSVQDEEDSSCFCIDINVPCIWMYLQYQ